MLEFWKIPKLWVHFSRRKVYFWNFVLIKFTRVLKTLTFQTGTCLVAWIERSRLIKNSNLSKFQFVFYRCVKKINWINLMVKCSPSSDISVQSNTWICIAYSCCFWVEFIFSLKINSNELLFVFLRLFQFLSVAHLARDLIKNYCFEKSQGLLYRAHDLRLGREPKTTTGSPAKRKIVCVPFLS